jgi:hypothetical protein
MKNNLTLFIFQEMKIFNPERLNSISSLGEKYYTREELLEFLGVWGYYGHSKKKKLEIVEYIRELPEYKLDVEPEEVFDRSIRPKKN